MNKIEIENITTHWIERFDRALVQRNLRQVAELFHEQCYWRDLVAFTWNIKTCEGRPALTDMLSSSLQYAAPVDWQLEQAPENKGDFIEAWCQFTTAQGKARAIIRLKNGLCWSILTTLQSLRGYEEKNGSNGSRNPGVTHGAVANRLSWLEERHDHCQRLGYSEQPYCLIIGGGQGGIALAARLKQLEVPTLVIEKNPRAGDSWRNRYRSLCLHDPVWYDHLPYIPFPEHWPIYTPKDKLGDWLEMYTKVMELDYWSSSECLGAKYDEPSAKWQVRVNRQGKEVILHPAQLVLATGMSGVPNIPEIPGQEIFKGEIYHSSKFTGNGDYHGKNCIVVGSNNSAHDICTALWEQEARVTMIQRSSSLVVKSETLAKGKVRSLYSEQALRDGITTERADLSLAATPYALMPAQQREEYKQIAEDEADFYNGLRKAGFNLDFGDDGSGLYSKYLRYGAGYYIDVGASQLIIDGEIKVKSSVSVARFGHNSVVLSNGEEIPADLVILATGYGSMHGWAARLISQQVADRIGMCWGLGSDTYRDPGPWVGELRNMWKPTQQPGLWFHGGNLQQSRHYSRYLALQIKARLEGIETPVYGLEETHHA